MPVTASNLNVSAEELADRTAYLTAIAGKRIHINNFVNVGDGVADDSAPLDAAVAELAGSGVVLLEPGKRYHRTTTLSYPGGVSFACEGGKATISFAALTTAPAVYMASGGPDAVSVFQNVNVESDAANSGTVFDLDAASESTLYLVGVTANAEGFFSGKLIAAPHANSRVVQDGPSDLRSAKSSAGEAITGAAFDAWGGRLEHAPVAGANLIATKRTRLHGVRLARSSVTGSFAFVTMVAAGLVEIFDCAGEYSAAGAEKTYLLDLVSTGRAVTKGNSWLLSGFQSYDLYKITSAPILLGSDLQLIPSREHATDAGPFTGSNGVRTEMVSASDATAPALVLPRILCQGQRYTQILENNSGGTWSGAPSESTTSPDAFASESGLAGMTNHQLLTRDFVSIYIDRLTLYHWLQVGKAVIL